VILTASPSPALAAKIGTSDAGNGRVHDHRQAYDLVEDGFAGQQRPLLVAVDLAEIPGAWRLQADRLDRGRAVTRRCRCRPVAAVLVLRPPACRTRHHR
jgi:hypothetical protein